MAGGFGNYLPEYFPYDPTRTEPKQRQVENVFRLVLCRHGESLAGLTHAEADQRYPVQHPVKVHHRPPEGESYLDPFRRVGEFYYETYYDQSLADKTLCVVAHGGTLNCLLDAAIGLPPLAEVDFSCADTSIHELQIQPGGRVRVMRLNATPHLAGLG